MGCTLDGKMLKKEPVTIQRNTDVYPPFGTDKSVLYEHAGGHPIQYLANFQFHNQAIGLLTADSLNWYLLWGFPG